MNDLVAHQNTAVGFSDFGGDALEAYGRKASQKSLVGDLLKFTKFGEFVAGKEETAIPHGTRLVALMDQLLVGFVRWSDNRPTDQEMACLYENQLPKQRYELGDMDPAHWGLDDYGKPKDPWQETNYLVLREEGGEQLYTYAPSSKSGLSAVAELINKFVQHKKMHPDQFPIVALGSSSYVHPKYKKIVTPKLDIVAWVAIMDGEEEAEPEALPKPAASGKSKAGAALAATATRF